MYQKQPFYTELGINSIDKSELVKTIEGMEKNLSEALTSSTIYRSLIEINNINGYKTMTENLFNKHKIQLKKLNLTPSQRWLTFEKQVNDLFKEHDDKYTEELEPNFETRIFSKVWKSPCDPTIRTHLDLELPADFENRFLTLISIYSCSRFLQDDNYKMSLKYVNNHKVIKIKTVNLGIRVLVDTTEGKEIGTVNLYNVEKMDINDINYKLLEGIETLRYWKNKRLSFMKTYKIPEKELYRSKEDFNFALTSLPTFSSDVPFTISNVGSLGFDTGFSALNSINTGDMCIGKINIKPKWDEKDNTFLPQKFVPLVFSIDHRIVNPHNFNVKKFKEIFSQISESCKTFNDSLDIKKISENILIFKEKIQKYDKEYLNYLSEKNKKKLLENLSTFTNII